MKTRKILMVEYLTADADVAVREISKALEEIEVCVVDTRAEFEDQLEKLEPDLIITTSKLPSFDALTVLTLTLNKSMFIPVIVLTGTSNDAAIVECIKAGAADCIDKEHIKKLGKAVVKVLEQNEIKKEQKRMYDSTVADLETYRSMFTNSPQPMYIYDRETHAFLEVNNSALELYGYTQAEFLSMTLKDISPIGDIPAVLKGSKTQPHYLTSIKWWNLKNSGETIHVEIMSLPVDFRGTKACLVQVTDVTKRKEVFENLSMSEEKYRAFFENMMDVYFQTDLEGNLYEISPSVQKYLGYSRVELRGNSVLSLYSDAKDRDSLIKSLLENGLVHDFKTRFSCKNGDIKHVSINACVLYDSEGKPDLVEGSIRDITEQFKTEEILRNNEEKFRRLFESHDAMKFIIDPETQLIVDVNTAAMQFYGWNMEEFKLLKVGETHTARPEVLTVLFKDIHKLGSLQYEARHRCKDGSMHDVNVCDSKIVISGKEFIYSVVHDITARKQTEQLQQIMSKSVEQGLSGVLVTNMEGVIEYANPKFSEISGYSLGEIKGKNQWVLYSGKHSGETYREMWDTVQTGKAWTGEYSVIRKNGELYWENVSISPLVNEKGVTTHLVTFVEDITTSHEMLETLKAAREKAEANDNLKSAIINNLSNEVRTPLNGIIGFTEMLVNPGFTKENKLNFVDIVKKSSTRLLNTIINYMDISMIVSGSTNVYKKHFTLDTVLDEFRTEFNETCKEKGIRFVVQHPETPDHIQLYTDPDILHKILNNLLGNAVKYTGKGTITLGFRRRNTVPEFYVTDTGIGIETDKIKSLFDNYTLPGTLKTDGSENSKLGLSIAKGLVELLGGRISVESELNKGSTFCFSLPAQVMVPTVSKKEVKAKQPPSINNPVILVAEDDDYNFKFIETVLNRADFKVVRAGNGAEAVEICHSNPNVNLVLMDLKMPVMGGVEATQKIHEFLPGLPIIALTAYVSSENENEAFLSGCKEFISKPVDRVHLLASVEHILGN